MQLHKPTKPKGTKRKKEFVDAFMRCIQQDSYASISMADVANEANVAPSHLFYYFESKEDLLRLGFQRQCDVIVAGVEAVQGDDLNAKIENISDFLFVESTSVNRYTTAFVYEAFGMTLNDSVLRGMKLDMDKRSKIAMAGIFFEADSVQASRDYKAEIVYALLVGTKLNVFFDPDNSERGLAYGQEVFRAAMRTFCAETPSLLPPILAA